NGLVLWTRLAPEFLFADPAKAGGTSGGPIPVDYEVASAPDFPNILRRGIGVADPEYAYVLIHVPQPVTASDTGECDAVLRILEGGQPHASPEDAARLLRSVPG